MRTPDAEVFTSCFSQNGRTSSVWGKKRLSENWDNFVLYSTNMSNVFSPADFGLSDDQVVQRRYSYIAKSLCVSGRIWAPDWLS